MIETFKAGRSIGALGLVVGLIVCGATTVRSASLELLGASGTPGTPGSDSGSGTDGGPGGAGENVSLSEGALSPLVDVVRVVGGDGGVGGAGGAPAGSGGSGGVGGSATARVSADAGPAVLFVEARGGDGGSGGAPGSAIAGTPGVAGAGGAATVDAELSNSGDVDLAVLARGGGGQTAGATSATAHAESTEGGAVRVSATQVGGVSGTDSDWTSNATVRMVNSVSGASTGELTLIQHAIGGSGTGSPSSAGHAQSWLEASNPLGGPLALDLEARGGDHTGAFDAERAGDASVYGRALDGVGAPVQIRAEAIGGNGGEYGGSAGFGFGSLHASSTTGDILIRGVARAGSGTAGGRSSTLQNGLSASTSGAIMLVQEAYGGDGRNPGGASSRLQASQASESLDVIVVAEGGDHVPDSAGVLDWHESGGSALADASATNQVGSSHAEAVARGGSSSPPRYFAEAGRATANAQAEAQAAGQPATALARAVGGDRTDVDDPYQLIHAGSAESESTVRADGDARAESTATGGDGLGFGGLVGPASWAGADATASGGGNTDAIARASSGWRSGAFATASGQRAGPTTAVSEVTLGTIDPARTRSGASYTEHASRAEATGRGHTTAHATATGINIVDVWASATGLGNGRVEAIADGQSVEGRGTFQYATSTAFSNDLAIARASVAGAGLHLVSSQSNSDTGPIRSAITEFYSEGSDRGTTGQTILGTSSASDWTMPESGESYARIVGTPGRSDALAWAAESPLRGADLGASTRILALGESRLLPSTSNSLTISFAADEIADLDFSIAFSESTVDSLQLAGEILYGRFGDIGYFDLAVSPEGTILSSWTPLDDPIVRLPRATGGEELVDLTMDFGSSTLLSSELIVRFAVLASAPVPEPALLVLLAAACAALIGRSRLRCRRI